MKTSEVLNTAADLIEERGWVQGAGWPGTDHRDRLCLEGGIVAALGIPKVYDDWSDEETGDFMACPAYRAVQDYLEFSLSLYWWNDQEERTGAEVIEVLRAAALVEAAKEDAPHPRVVEAVRILHGPAAADRLAGAR